MEGGAGGSGREGRIEALRRTEWTRREGQGTEKPGRGRPVGKETDIKRYGEESCGRVGAAGGISKERRCVLSADGTAPCVCVCVSVHCQLPKSTLVAFPRQQVPLFCSYH